MRREDEGEEPGHAERDQHPDEAEASAGVRDAAGDADTLPLHVEDGDAKRKERPEDDDDVPRSPFGEHQRPVQPDDHDDTPPNQVVEPSRFPSAYDVVRQVKREQENREQRRDG